MKRLLLTGCLLFFCFIAEAQRLAFEKLEQMLKFSKDRTEEELFLLGYTFLNKDSVSDKRLSHYTFTNRKNTIGTAKRVVKTVFQDPNKSSLRYITYDRPEFQAFRKLMIDHNFIRNGGDKISENSLYSKNSLIVSFEVSKDEYENPVFNIILSRDKPETEKNSKKLSLKNLLKLDEL